MPSEKNSAPQAPLQKMRIDKWLWCARFYKTRSLASQAVEGGKIRLNQERIKPAQAVAPGDRVSIQLGEFNWQIEIVALSWQRSAAPIAQTLYREEAASLARRQQQMLEKAATPSDLRMKGRPTKRDRRHIRRFMPS